MTTIPTRVVAHAAGNEAADIKEAVRLGADFVEADVHLTADSRLVVHRAPHLGSECGNVRLCEVDFDALQQLRRDAGWPPLAELREVQAACQLAGIGLVVDVKNGPVYYDTLAETLGDALTVTHAGTRVTSYDHVLIAQLANLGVGCQLGISVTARLVDPATLLSGAGATLLWLQNRFATRDVIEATHDFGAQVCVSTDYHPEALAEYRADPPAADLVSCDLVHVATITKP